MSLGERIRKVWYIPFVVGVLGALLAIGLSVFGMIRNPEATPLNLRSLLLVTVLAGGTRGFLACVGAATVTL